MGRWRISRAGKDDDAGWDEGISMGWGGPGLARMPELAKHAPSHAPSCTVKFPPTIKNRAVCFREIDCTFNQSPFVYTVSLKGRDNKEIIHLKE